jgi:hypothetical protein
LTCVADTSERVSRRVDRVSHEVEAAFVRAELSGTGSPAASS